MQVKKKMKTRRAAAAALGLIAAAAVPGPAHGLELSATVTAGLFQVGTSAMFAVMPSLTLRLGPVQGLDLTLADGFMMFPGPGAPFGFDNRLSVGLGYSWPAFDVDVAGSLSGYWMHACGAELCGRVMGLAPGARARVSYFPWSSSLGITLAGDVGWYGGDSLVLPGNAAATITAGPVLRWQGK
jgi:hypothetical protein